MPTSLPSAHTASSKPATQAPTLALCVLLPPGPPPHWVVQCLGAWQVAAGLRVSVCQPQAPRSEAAPAASSPAAAFNASTVDTASAAPAAMAAPTAGSWWRRRVPALAPTPLPPGIPVDSTPPAGTDWLLVLHERALDLLPTLRPGLRCWLLADGEGAALATDWPLLGPVTRGQGVTLQLLAGRSDGPWGPVARRARWGASTRYGEGLRGLGTAVTELVLQAAADRRLGLLPPAPGAQAPLQRRGRGPVPWRACLAGRWRAWAALQASRWYSEYWRIGVVDAPVLDWVASGGTLPVRWITRSAHRGYWADPMGMVGDGHRLFCEYFDEIQGRGRLETLDLDEAGEVRHRQPLPVAEGAHASFPLVMDIGGRRVGVAESVASGCCRLYEVTDDGRWQPLAELLPGVPAADPALFVWQGRYWLAITDLRLGVTDNLCLYHAPHLEGPWQPHANNPVKRDITGARMAGGFFWDQGQLYRPAQDCLAGYGAAVTLYRVLRCSPEDYAEEPVAHIAPDPQGPCPDGLHTLSAWGQRTLIDGKRMGINPLALRRKLSERLWPAHTLRALRARQPATALAQAGQPHVAVYVPHLRMGGGETSLLRLAGGFVRAGQRVDLIVHTLRTAEVAPPPGVNVLSLDTEGTAGALRRLARLLRERQPPVLLSGFPHTNVAAVAAAALSGVPIRCVLTEHAPLTHQIRLDGGWRYRVLPPLVRWAYRRAAAVVAVSDGVREDLARMAGDGLPLQVIANPVLDEPAPGAEVAGAAPGPVQPLHPWLDDPSLRVVLSVSRLAAEKGLHTLLEAFAQLHAQQPDTRLIMAGEGTERAALEAAIAQRGLQQAVALPGRVTPAMAWMRQSAVFVLASEFEGFGNVLVEALASGVPVVSTDCPVGPREILRDGRYGRLVPVGDAPALAEALAQTLAQPGPVPGALAHAAQFTTARATEHYLGLFDHLLRGAPC